MAPPRPNRRLTTKYWGIGRGKPSIIWRRKTTLATLQSTKSRAANHRSCAAAPRRRARPPAPAGGVISEQSPAQASPASAETAKPNQQCRLTWSPWHFSGSLRQPAPKAHATFLAPRATPASRRTSQYVLCTVRTRAHSIESPERTAGTRMSACWRPAALLISVTRPGRLVLLGCAVRISAAFILCSVSSLRYLP